MQMDQLWFICPGPPRGAVSATVFDMKPCVVSAVCQALFSVCTQRVFPVAAAVTNGHIHNNLKTQIYCLII